MAAGCSGACSGCCGLTVGSGVQLRCWCGRLEAEAVAVWEQQSSGLDRSILVDERRWEGRGNVL